MIAWKDGATGFLEIDGQRLEWAAHGPPPQETATIILLHEGLGCVSLWRDFPQKLAETTGLGVFVYSRAGYGQSSPAELPRPIDYMTREAVDVLPKIIDALAPERAILIGHSDGATIAAIHAGSVADFRVRGLVLMAPHFFTEPAGLSSIAAARTAYDEGALREKLARHHGDVENAFNGWCDAWLNPDFQAWNVTEAIDYLRIPTLAIQGVDDQYGTLAQIRELEERAYSPVDVEIMEDCAHAPHLEQPDKTLVAIGDFCERLLRIETEPVTVVHADTAAG